jgi:hypothetical protein
MAARGIGVDRAFSEEGAVSRKGSRMVALGHPRVDGERSGTRAPSHDIVAAMFAKSASTNLPTIGIQRTLRGCQEELACSEARP